MPANKTKLERIFEEALRPIEGAIRELEAEIAETMNVPTAPWKILNKPYDSLSDQEIAALMDIYHQDGEEEPCPMCQWVSRVELQKMRAEQSGNLPEIRGA